MPISHNIGGKTITLTDEERQPCEIWSRVMGYLRPTTEWNLGKQSEFKDRRFFTEATALKRQPAPATPPADSP